MSTVSKANAKELVDIIRLVARENVSIFNFARLVPIGRGRNLEGEMLTSEDYKLLLLNVSEEYKRLKEKGCKTEFGRKDHLWTLLYFELESLKALPIDKKMIYSGCSIGINTLTILADGTVLACRRLPIKIGEVPNQRIRDIFINSENLNKLRNVDAMVKCGKCKLIQFCRGCPAVAFGATNDYLNADPQCWIKLDEDRYDETSQDRNFALQKYEKNDPGNRSRIEITK